MSSNLRSTDYPTGRTVPFPYESPYRQQVDFMDALLSSLAAQTKIMLLESPTGTGKSLSLACSAMAWLRYKEQADFEKVGSTHDSATIDKDDWLNDWVDPEVREQQREATMLRERARTTREALQRELQNIHDKLTEKNNNRERRENLVRSGVTAAKLRERQGRRIKKKKILRDRIDEDFCVADYRSDHDDQDDSNDSDQEGVDTALSLASHLLDGAALDGSSVVHGKTALGNVQSGSGLRKIVYAARTHSQLSQFVSELRRTGFSGIRVVALGGRKVLCGNSDVNRPGRSEQAVNDACLDLKKDKTSSCPLLSSTEGIATLALHTLAQPSDIEDAAALGEASHACSYYASRVSSLMLIRFVVIGKCVSNQLHCQKSLAAAEVVVMPYSMLLSKSSREAVGLCLKQCLVLVDEAHNLPEAIRSLHSCRLSLSVALAATDQLSAYIKRYTDRLAGRNLYYLGQLRKCLNAFVRHLQGGPQQSIKMISAGELLMDLKLDNVNLFKIISYLKQSRLAQKLLGFANATSTVDSGASGISKHVSALSIVETFLSKLTSTSSEGKVVTDWPKVDFDVRSTASAQEPTLRFAALHPAVHFRDVVNEAIAVALVGGTLRPFNHVAAELLDTSYLVDATTADASAQAETNEVSITSFTPTLTAFTCDHVVPHTNIMLQCLSCGPSRDVPLDFRHKSRGNQAVLDELGLVIVQLSAHVPAGMVVFLPSYSYEALLVRRWKESDWSKLNRQKRVHREPKQSSQVEATLAAYSKDACTHGSLLLSVVGGKMSEGINFADDMARCVMVVGLPYPDITDPELKEKMATMDQTPGGISGQAYYHSLCMRAVNQTVGRAIRHAGDYASIILVDQRYCADRRIWKALPVWLTRGTGQERISFDSCIDAVKRFFTSRPVVS
ncbi:hypothetical protein MHU86_17651 [Fragilaria crotonensis]|nr:hypothetical protein MHU86_17651 [Fragilaria crotonensis]